MLCVAGWTQKGKGKAGTAAAGFKLDCENDAGKPKDASERTGIVASCELDGAGKLVCRGCEEKAGPATAVGCGLNDEDDAGKLKGAFGGDITAGWRKLQSKRRSGRCCFCRLR